MSRIPATSIEHIKRAAAVFDAECRPMPDWMEWEQAPSQKFALQLEGKLYPPKKIVSLATGLPVSEFSGGEQTNGFLAKMGFSVVRLDMLQGQNRTGLEGKLRWMFQCDPERYDLRTAVRDLAEMTWRAKAHVKRIAPGDYVILWNSGDKAGIYALAEVRSYPAEMEMLPREFDYCKDPDEFRGSRSRVLLRGVSVVEPYIMREEVQAQPEIGDFPLWRGVRGTNFEIPALAQDRLLEFVIERSLRHTKIPVAEGLEDSARFTLPEDVFDARRRIEAALVSRQGQSAFRRELMQAYGGRCAVTGFLAGDALEAAHIYPYRGSATNHIQNGLLLRADIHTLFDRGLLGVDTTEMRIVIAPGLEGTEYEELAGQPLRLPVNLNQRPNVEALDRHRRMFGLPRASNSDNE